MRTASFSLLTILCLLLFVAPAMAGWVYWNGPYDGNTAAWPINFGFSVSDSYTNWTAGRDITVLNFVYWDLVPGDVLTTVDAQFGPDPFSGAVNTYSATHNKDLGSNHYGYELYEATVLINPYEPGEGGFLTLSNACTTSGCSTNPIYWDENSGPSIAFENEVGSIPSEAFTLQCAPEPSSILLFGSCVLGPAGILRRKLGR